MTLNAYWLEDAYCRTPEFKEQAVEIGAWRNPSQVFFPITSTDDDRPFEGGKEPRKYRLRQEHFKQLARKACDECVSRDECLFDGLVREQEPYGIFGGMDEENRSDLMLMDSPKIVSRLCVCGTRLYGTPRKLPERCSSLCVAPTQEDNNA